MKELTRQQQAVYDFVKSYIEKKSYPPTIREIGAAVGLSSTSTVHSHVKTLIDKGYLISSPSTQRTIALAMPENKQRHVMDVPCVGTVAAGTPILAFDDVTESLPLPTSLLHGAKNGLPALMRCQFPKPVCSRKFQVHAHAICQIPRPGDQFRSSTWNGFQMNISLKMIFITKKIYCTKQFFHSPVWTFLYSGT